MKLFILFPTILQKFLKIGFDDKNKFIFYIYCSFYVDVNFHSTPNLVNLVTMVKDRFRV
jgi:hypothetical protein